MIRLVDPTVPATPPMPPAPPADGGADPAPAPAWGPGAGAVDLAGASIGLLANGKPNGEELLDLVTAELGARHALGPVLRITKANPSLPPSDVELERLAQVDVVLSAIGDCGSCSSGTVRDGVELAKLGVATTVLVTEAFVAPSQAMAALSGMPDYRFVVVPHPTAALRGTALAEVAAASARQVEAILLAPPPPP